MIVLFVIAFSRLDFFTLNYLGHNSGWQEEEAKGWHPKGEKDGHHKELRGQTCTDCLVRQWAMWVWDSRLTWLKLSMCLIIFMASDPESWTAYQIPQPGHRCGSPLSFGMGTSFRWELVQEMWQDCPPSQPKPWAAGSGHSFKDIHPARAPLQHRTHLWGEQTLGDHLCCFYYLLLSTECISQWQVKRYVGIFLGTKYIHFHTYKYGCGYILYICVQTLKWEMSSAN